VEHLWHGGLSDGGVFCGKDLTPAPRRYVRGKRYNLEKRQGERTDLTSPHNEGKSDTAERLADAYQVSPAAIERDGEFADAVIVMTISILDQI
jgi:hypothetical protein